MPRYARVIDLERCMGCRACMEACKVENATPQGIFWMYVMRLESGEYPNVRVSFLPRPCMHCDKSPCTQVCPVGATYKDDKGRTMQDSSRCIGCRYCMQVCPYGARYFNERDPKENYYLDWKEAGEELARTTGGAVPPYRSPDLDGLYPVGLPEFEGKQAPLAGGGHMKGVVEKCTLCVQRVEKGLLPACVANCPMKAQHVGDSDDPRSEVSELLRQRTHWPLLPEYGTQPAVYYLGGQPPAEAAREIEEAGVMA